MSEYKTCRKCLQHLSLEMFGLKLGKPLPKCKPCTNEASRQARLNNKESFRAKDRERYKANRDVLLQRAKDYRQKNKDKIRDANRNWYQKNRENVLEKTKIYYLEIASEKREYAQQYRRKNREKVNERIANWRARNPEYARKYYQMNPQVISQINANRRQKISQGRFSITAKEIKKIYASACIYCGAPATHIDHVVPLARGGRHCIGNLAPACAFCNLSKGAKFISEWKKVRGDWHSKDRRK